MRWLSSRPLLLPLACALAAAAFVVWNAGDRPGFDRLFQPKVWGLVALAGVVLARWACATIKFRLFAMRWPRPFGWRDCFVLQLVGTCGAAVTPAASGMTPSCLWYLWKRRIAGPQAMAAMVYITAIDAVLFSVTVPALLPRYISLVGGVPTSEIVILTLVLSAGALVFAFLLLGAPRRLVRWVGAALYPFPRASRRVLPALLRAAAAIGDLRRAPLLFHLAAYAITVVEWVAIYLALPAAAWALDLRVSWVSLLVIQHIVQVVAFVFPTPGGSGLFEAGLPVAAGSAWPEEASASLILLWRFFSYGIYLVLAAWLGSAFLAQAFRARSEGADERGEGEPGKIEGARNAGSGEANP